MRGYRAFCKKEILENIANYKLLVTGTLFFLIGIVSPLTAKFMPDVLQEVMPEGMTIVMPDPTALDSWAQFYKTMSQIGFILFVVVFSGVMVSEFSQGTLINVLTKGLSRKAVIFAKFTVVSLYWTMAFCVAFIMTLFYTNLFWDKQPNTEALLFSGICLWLFGIFLVTVVILGSVIFKSIYGCLIFTAAVAGILLLFHLPEKLQMYNPITLAMDNMKMLTEWHGINDYWKPILFCVAAGIVIIMSAIGIFNRSQKL